MALLVDTNVLLAAPERSALEHAICVALLDHHQDLLVTAPVAAESAWMGESRLGPAAEAAFVRSVADGELDVVDLTGEDWSRCADLIETYRDLRLGLVDASIVAVAERLRLVSVATMNRRDFRRGAPGTLCRVSALSLTPL